MAKIRKKQKQKPYFSLIRIKRDPDYKRIYKIWHCMRARCYNKTNINYYKYGRRGIRVCILWHKFNNFYTWALSNGYAPTLTIDRINGKKGYSPENCRWFTKKQQANNSKINRRYTHNGQDLTMTEWAESVGIHPSTFRMRLERGWSLEKSLSTPLGQSHMVRKSLHWHISKESSVTQGSENGQP